MSKKNRPDTPDFKRIINELLKCGFTATSIAEHVDTSQPVIHYLRSGKTRMPRYDTGKRLVELHEREWPLYLERRNKPVPGEEKSPLRSDADNPSAPAP